MARTPRLLNASEVFFPIPGILSTGSGARKASSRPSSTMVNPSGLCMSDAILATNLAGAIPTEQVTRVVARI